MSEIAVRRAGTIALLHEIEVAGAAGPTFLDLSARPDLPLETFEAIARFLGALHDQTAWAIADLLLEAEVRFGESASQVAAATGRSERTLLNWCWVASRIPRSRRREGLSFSAHAAVAALDLEGQRDLLDRAVAGEWSSREMRQAVRERRQLGGEEERDLCAEAVDEAARNLRVSLRGCGLADFAVAVEISSGSVSYSVRIP